MPQVKSNNKTFGFISCTSGPLSATVRIPRYGYIVGENIPISAEIENLSDKLMNCTKARLIEDVTFRTSHNVTLHSTRTTLQEVQRGPIAPGESDEWNYQPLLIPPIPPSSLGECRIIDISYHLEFRVVPSGIGWDLVVEIPIIIGTIPFRSDYENVAAARPNLQQSLLPVGEHFSQPAHNQLVPDLEDASTPPSQSTNPNQTNGGLQTKAYAPFVHPIPPIEDSNLPPPSYADSVAAYEDGRPNQLRSEKDSEHTDGIDHTGYLGLKSQLASVCSESFSDLN
jgi:hypothetical protein